MLSKVKSLGLLFGFSLFAGAALLPSACGSSRGNAAQGDAEIPGPIAARLSACAEERKTHFEPTRHAISFEIEFDEDGQVDEVQLKDSTLEDQGLEACMVSVLRSLTVDDLPVRMSGNGSLNGVGPESRGLMGQEQVFLCFASPPCVFALGMLIGASFLTVQIYANMAQSSSIAKPWAGPIATAIPKLVPAGKHRKRCDELTVECLESPYQPKWNQEDFGRFKNCKDCQQECYDQKGEWPNYKCPRP